MPTLSDRLFWILENGHDPFGRPWSRRSLSLAAGLSQSHVGQMVRGTITEKQASLGTLNAIAAAAKVDPTWLAYGMGAPGLGVEPVPNRAAAAVLSREDGVCEEAIQSVLAEDVPPLRLHLSTLWWTRRMRLREAALLGLDDGSPPGDGSGERPVRDRRR